MSEPTNKQTRRFTEAARLAVLAAKAAKKAQPDRFGEPELYNTRAADKAFTWELRRFGGLVLQRGEKAYPDQSEAETAGAEALSKMHRRPDLPKFKRQHNADR